jgi:hypothetical protein
MNGFDPKRTDAALAGIEARLRDEVPRATAPELDRIKLRAMAAQASRERSTRRSEFMRSRIAVAMMLVCGFLLSGTGAGLAVSGISGEGSAAVIQYPTETKGGQQGILGQQGGSDQGTGAEQEKGADKGSSGSQGIAGETAGEAAQAARQVAVSGGDSGLPFTGFAAIPLLLIGVGLVAAGFVTRRSRTASD